MCRGCVSHYGVVRLRGTGDDGVVGGRRGGDGEKGESLALTLQRMVLRVRAIVAVPLLDESQAEAIHYPEGTVAMPGGAVEIPTQVCLVSDENRNIFRSIYEICTRGYRDLSLLLNASQLGLISSFQS